MYLSRFAEEAAILVEEVAGVLVDTNNGQFIELNVTAVEMVDALLKHADPDRAASSLLEVLDVDRSTLMRDMWAMHDQLVGLKLFI